ncbi:hypothetical protein [Methanobrevibacter sp.]|uniref:hypothetical protein n=1 Tax=Methanobrevibacter sp. TaxID=66852 RepID=UPI00388D71FD
MIKHFFRNEENKCKELLIVISKSVYQQNYEGLTYKEFSEIQMEELNQKLEEKDNTIKKQQKEIEKLKQQISNR